jgi:S-adenosylmethionine decarboxylase
MPEDGSLDRKDFDADGAARSDSGVRSDYFVERDGLVFAGSHLLADFWGVSGIDDMAGVEAALREAVEACDATLLHIHLHRFSASGGISGVAILAESHISVHTWPERAYAAIDIFMCGKCNPIGAIPVLRRHFRPASVQICEQKRGLIE